MRAVRRADLDPVIAIDATVTGLEKRAYWQRVYRRYGIAARGEQRWFLVAELDGRVVGFLIGEVRDWEFGSPPCGWVFAIDVDPQIRQSGIASQLMAALSTSLRRAGVRKLRTLLARDNTLILVISDNGGSAEGTTDGTPNVFAGALGRPVPVDEAIKHYDIMGEDPTFPHYPIGWSCVSNTPFRMYKQYTHLGGVADPLSPVDCHRSAQPRRPPAVARPRDAPARRRRRRRAAPASPGGPCCRRAATPSRRS